MNSAPTTSNLLDSRRSIGSASLIAPGVVIASVSYFIATSSSLPSVVEPGAVIDVFLASAVPSLVVIMLLWVARPAAYPRPRRRGLVAAALLFAVAAALLPLWFAPV